MAKSKGARGAGPSAVGEVEKRALAVAGALLQAVLGNGLAGPNIIGVNAGAGLSVLALSAFFPQLTRWAPLAAFAGALLAALTVYLLALHSGAGQALRDSATTGEPQLYVAISDGSKVLRLSQTFDQIRALQRLLLLAVCGTALLTLAVAWALSYAAARRVLRPIEALRQGAGRIAEGDLSYRIPAQPDEMGALAGDFNDMADKLSKSLQHERTQRIKIGLLDGKILTADAPRRAVVTADKMTVRRAVDIGLAAPVAAVSRCDERRRRVLGLNPAQTSVRDHLRISVLFNKYR